MNPQWFAAYTRSRHEGRVAEQLQQKGVECLFPTYETYSRWSDRKKRVRAPLFPGYVFAHIDDQERIRVLQTFGVVNIVSVAGKPQPLPDREIEVLRGVLAAGRDVEPHPYLKVGKRVRVKRGPFAGWDGLLVEKKNGARLVVSIEQIMRAVAIDIHTSDVEAVA